MSYLRLWRGRARTTLHKWGSHYSYCIWLVSLWRCRNVGSVPRRSTLWAILPISAALGCQSTLQNLSQSSWASLHERESAHSRFLYRPQAGFSEHCVTRRTPKQKCETGPLWTLGHLNEKKSTAVLSLKERLISPSILALLWCEGPHTLSTKACDMQIWSTPLDNQKDESSRHVGHWTCTSEREGTEFVRKHRNNMAVLRAVTLLRSYSEEIFLAICTYHEALGRILTISEATGRLGRRHLKLMELELETFRRFGRKEQAAELLSRLKPNVKDETPLDNEVPVLTMYQTFLMFTATTWTHEFQLIEDHKHTLTPRNLEVCMTVGIIDYHKPDVSTLAYIFRAQSDDADCHTAVSDVE